MPVSRNSAEHSRFVRRNRVDERFATAIAVVAGVVACLAGAAPTGSSFVDYLVVGLAIAVATWASASAPWWASASAAGIAAAIALDPVVIAVSGIAFLAGLTIGIRRRDQSELRAVVGGVAMNALVRSELEGFFGLSAIIGVSVGVSLFVLGLRRRPSVIRRPGWIAAAAVAVVGVVALGGVAVSGLSARPDLESGTRNSRQALTAVNAGDYDTAADLFDDAARDFGSVDDQLSGLLAVPAQFVPGVAQNVAAGSELAGAAASATAEAAAALREVDPESLTIAGGAIDLDAVRAIEAPLVGVQEALADVGNATARARSPWLLGPIVDELDELDEELAENGESLDKAVDAAKLAPQLLGGDEMRRYLLLFTSPSEARGVAGFAGNYAVVEIDQGQIRLTDFDRRSELEQLTVASGARCLECDDDFVQAYGQYSIAIGAERVAGVRSWSNLTMPAHFPYVGEAAATLYTEATGQPIDGVLSVDPYVVQALMQYTGSVNLPELGVTVDPNNAAEFILHDQYLLGDINDMATTDNADRIDALDRLGGEVIARLLVSSLPDPQVLASDFGPLVEEQRLVAWMAQPEEQSLMEQIGMAGALPELGESSGFGVGVTNGGHSKIDYFLERDVDVRLEGEPGEERLVAEVTLTNGSPAGGLPRYVIGNSFGLPEGTSRPLVTFYGPPGLLSAERDGEPIELLEFDEAGWSGYRRHVAIGPGESTTFRLEFPYEVTIDGEFEPALYLQPLAR